MEEFSSVITVLNYIRMLLDVDRNLTASTSQMLSFQEEVQITPELNVMIYHGS